MILIAKRTLFHCVLTGKITETISDGDYIEECNHLQDKWRLICVFHPYCSWIMPPPTHPHPQQWWNKTECANVKVRGNYYEALEASSTDYKVTKGPNSCGVLTGTPWGPSGPGNPVSPIGPLSPCQKTEAASVSAGVDKRLTCGLTVQRELESCSSPALLGSLALHERQASPVNHKYRKRTDLVWQVLNSIISAAPL